MKLPSDFLEFVRFVYSRANGRPIIGWGVSRGAKWLTELVREHAGLLFGAVMFCGYPQTRCPYEQQACAMELISAKDCAICMVHFTSDESCGVRCFPFWHAEFQRHMADMATCQGQCSPLLSLDLPGNHAAARPYWQKWQIQNCPALQQWFDTMWRSLVVTLTQ